MVWSVCAAASGGNSGVKVIVTERLARMTPPLGVGGAGRVCASFTNFDPSGDKGDVGGRGGETAKSKFESQKA